MFKKRPNGWLTTKSVFSYAFHKAGSTPGKSPQRRVLFPLRKNAKDCSPLLHNLFDKGPTAALLRLAICVSTTET